MDKPRIEAAVRELLLAIGEDPDREGLQETPRRVADMYEEIFAGLEEDPRQHLKIFSEQNDDEIVTVRYDMFVDCMALLDYGFEHYQMRQIAQAGPSIPRIPHLN